MISLIEKTYKYIDDLNENDTNKLLENITDFYSFDLDIKKKWLRQKITLNYFDYSIRDELIIKEIENESVKTFIKNNPNQKLNYAFELYREAKFSDNAKIGTFLKSLGVTFKNQNNFVDKKEMEDALFKIIQSGILINYFEWILTIDLIYDVRIFIEFNQKILNFKKIKKYDKRENVDDFEIQMINIIRKTEYASPKPQKMNEFESIMLSLDTNNSKINILKLIKESLTKKNRKEIKNHFKSLFDQILKTKKRAEVIKIFKDYFHIIFENNLNGLLTEESFAEENDVNEDFVGKYCGNYMKYYSTRIKTLVGI
jgi:hypothetical protein